MPVEPRLTYFTSDLLHARQGYLIDRSRGGIAPSGQPHASDRPPDTLRYQSIALSYIGAGGSMTSLAGRVAAAAGTLILAAAGTGTASAAPAAAATAQAAAVQRGAAARPAGAAPA